VAHRVSLVSRIRTDSRDSSGRVASNSSHSRKPWRRLPLRHSALERALRRHLVRDMSDVYNGVFGVSPARR